MTDYQQIRARLDQELLAGARGDARESLRELWRLQPSASTAGVILGHRDLFPNVRPLRVAILRAFTVEPLIPLLQAVALFHGLDISVYTGAFNAYAQEMLEPPRDLLDFDPEVVILAVRTPDLLPHVWTEFPSLEPSDPPVLVDNALRQIDTWVQSFRRRCPARLIVHALEQPITPAHGLLDQLDPAGQCEAILAFNRGLKAQAAAIAGVTVLDYDALIARHGREGWYDAARWSTVRLPIAARHLHHLAGEWLRHLYAMAGVTRKVLVTDLDNTLWGGLAGEEGLEAIHLGPTHDGLGYLELQRVLADLNRRGILLAVCSKNNEVDALRILEQHPAMLLRPADFAALRINWRDKALNLREIAAELNLGLDALVFLDDNPAERRRVRAELPEVEVIDLPENPLHFAQALRDSVWFERLAVTEEDRLRTRQYREQRERVELAQAAGSLEEFYRSLRQVVTIEPLRRETLARVAQLTQKTNQFNLTTRRYSEAQLSQLFEAPGWTVDTVRVEDRFGDNGLVGVIATRRQDHVCLIDTFLLSCRVIGRTVESAVLAWLASECAREGMRELRGQFVATRKNAPAATLFPDHGFQPLAPDGDGSWWTLDLASADLAAPAWIELRVAPEYANC